LWACCSWCARHITEGPIATAAVRLGERPDPARSTVRTTVTVDRPRFGYNVQRYAPPPAHRVPACLHATAAPALRAMSQAASAPPSRAAIYGELAERLSELIAEQTDFIANLSNFAALLFNTLAQLNWVGFYLLHGTDLVLGPFQGKPACSLIATGEGVCGKAALQRAAVLVPDVRAFPGHILCDEMSRSEMVLPLFKEARLVGVLDMDSPVLNRFDATDSECVQRLVQQLMTGTLVPEWRLTPSSAPAP
jgi:GAF domain-containing protein